MGWGAPGLGDDLGWGGEATRDAQVCGGGPTPLGLLERDVRCEDEECIIKICSLRVSASTTTPTAMETGT